jgi:hypothetical protein
MALEDRRLRPHFTEVTQPIRPEYVVDALSSALPDDVILRSYRRIRQG